MQPVFYYHPVTPIIDEEDNSFLVFDLMMRHGNISSNSSNSNGNNNRQIMEG